MNDDELRLRLRTEMDRVQPPNSTPRYLSAPARNVTWRLAPAMLAMTLLAILALSGFVATGSPNPVVWGQRAVTVVEAPKASPSPTPPRATPTPKPTVRPTPTRTQEPNDNSGHGGSGHDGGGDDHGGSSSDSD